MILAVCVVGLVYEIVAFATKKLHAKRQLPTITDLVKRHPVWVRVLIALGIGVVVADHFTLGWLP